MHFDKTELREYVLEHARVDGLKVNGVYFIIEYVSADFLVPAVRPVVFVGRNVREGDTGKIYFQDYESYSNGQRLGGSSASGEGRIDVFLENQSSGVFEFDEALKELVKCSRRRAGAVGE